jgi:hypothetical protein
MSEETDKPSLLKMRRERRILSTKSSCVRKKFVLFLLFLPSFIAVYAMYYQSSHWGEVSLFKRLSSQF